jgi:hypothetical protein
VTATNVELLLRECVTAAWQPEPALLAHVRQHLDRPVPDRTIQTTLDLLAARGQVEARQFPGYTHLHWRRT